MRKKKTFGLEKKKEGNEHRRLIPGCENAVRNTTYGWGVGNDAVLFHIFFLYKLCCNPADFNLICLFIPDCEPIYSLSLPWEVEWMRKQEYTWKINRLRRFWYIEGSYVASRGIFTRPRRWVMTCRGSSVDHYIPGSRDRATDVMVYIIRPAVQLQAGRLIFASSGSFDRSCHKSPRTQGPVW